MQRIPGQRNNEKPKLKVKGKKLVGAGSKLEPKQVMKGMMVEVVKEVLAPSKSSKRKLAELPEQAKHFKIYYIA